MERPDGAFNETGPIRAFDGTARRGTQRPDEASTERLYMSDNSPTWAPMVDNSWPSIGTQRSTALYGHNGPTWAPMVDNGWPL